LGKVGLDWIGLDWVGLGWVHAIIGIEYSSFPKSKSAIFFESLGKQVSKNNFFLSQKSDIKRALKLNLYHEFNLGAVLQHGYQPWLPKRNCVA
jgi:hypothetical protein